METHRFNLVLSGVSEIDPELANALFEATGGDIEFNFRDGVAYLEFEREGGELRDAITSAIAQVEKAGMRVLRVETETANTVAKINAELLSAS
jgi:hypothetical protein